MDKQRRVRLFATVASFLALLATGAWVQHLGAVDDGGCDHGECEHSHRRFWFDSHRCVPNENDVACGTDHSEQHGCETTSCGPA